MEDRGRGGGGGGGGTGAIEELPELVATFMATAVDAFPNAGDELADDCEFETPLEGVGQDKLAARADETLAAGGIGGGGGTELEEEGVAKEEVPSALDKRVAGFVTESGS